MNQTPQLFDYQVVSLILAVAMLQKGCEGFVIKLLTD